MKKLVLLLSTLALFSLAFAQSSPVGRWKTIDDVTGKKRSIVQIYESGGKVYGKIIKVFKQAGDTGICDKCPGSFRGKPIVGLRFMWNLKKTASNVWDNGKILDPKIGKIYRCKITLRGSGKRLAVRGYIGISLLGRTQTWYRA